MNVCMLCMYVCAYVCMCVVYACPLRTICMCVMYAPYVCRLCTSVCFCMFVFMYVMYALSMYGIYGRTRVCVLRNVMLCYVCMLRYVCTIC